MAIMQSDRPYYERREPAEVKRAGIASIAIVIAALALCIFGPHHDPTKVVVGIPCSVISEAEIGATLGTPVQLMPSDGTICRYVPTDPRHTHTLYVVAQRGIVPSDATTISDSAAAASPAVTVRTGARRYTLRVVPAGPDTRATHTAELRLAKLVQRPVIAANR
jgi:hypothetical protein